MGLDMYLKGSKSLMRDWNAPEEEEQEDGFRVEEKILSLGYWRKHPNLHGYIVKQFAGGEDKCQDISLDKDDLLNLIDAIENDKLIHTEGFFFGHSLVPGDEEYEEQKQDDLVIFNRALEWVTEENTSSWRSVVYRASW